MYFWATTKSRGFSMMEMIRSRSVSGANGLATISLMPQSRAAMILAMSVWPVSMMMPR